MEHKNKRKRRRDMHHPDRFIARIDHGGTHAWEVKFDRQEGYHSKTFTDAKYGGCHNSLAAARRHRDQKENQYGGPSQRIHAHTRDRRNNTGVIGVSHYRVKRFGFRRGDYWAEGYRARWGSEKSERTKSYSFSRYGKKRAYELACLARKRGVAAIYAECTKRKKNVFI